MNVMNNYKGIIVLDGYYKQGRKVSSYCNMTALEEMVKWKAKEGFKLRMVFTEGLGLLIPEDRNVIRHVNEGRTVIMKSKKTANIIITRAQTPEEREANKNTIYETTTHIYDTISVCESKQLTKVGSHARSNMGLE